MKKIICIKCGRKITIKKKDEKYYDRGICNSCNRINKEDF